jgi:SAM-dependent methyltransferase
MVDHQHICPACRGQRIEIRHGWLFECMGCGLLSSSLKPEIPTSSGLSQINENVRGRGLAAIRRQNNIVILDHIERALGTNKRTILDVGCGLGQFMRDATERGFNVIGIEPDANVAPAAAALSGREVRAGFFPDVVAPDERFDVIVFNDVFEHIPDAAGAIKACRTFLALGGLLVINCPDRRGIFYRCGNLLDRLGISGPFHRLWQKGLPSPHVWYFTPSDLIRIGQSVGLEKRSTVSLMPITYDGLADRIFYIEGQSKFLGVMTYIGTLLAFPLLRLLPHDVGVVFLGRSQDDGG